MEYINVTNKNIDSEHNEKIAFTNSKNCKKDKKVGK